MADASLGAIGPATFTGGRRRPGSTVRGGSALAHHAIGCLGGVDVDTSCARSDDADSLAPDVHRLLWPSRRVAGKALEGLDALEMRHVQL